MHFIIRYLIIYATVLTVGGAWADMWTDPDTGYTWIYHINGDGAEIYNNGSAAISPSPQGMATVTIPSTLGGKPVTDIGESAFRSCNGMMAVIIPDSVTSIRQDAFRYCWGLADVRIPNSVTSIGQSAFSDCSGLTAVTIPDSVTSVGASAFSGCSSLTNMVLPFVGARRGNSGSSEAVFGYIFGTSSYTGSTGILQYYSSYSANTFYIPTSLRSVTVTDETVLGYGAFYNCNTLTDVTIPNSVTSIGSAAFSGSSSLTNVVLPFVGARRGNSGSSEAVFGYIFGTSSYTGSTGILQYYSSYSANTFYIPTSLRSVTVTDETVLGYGAFYNCSGLTNVTIPDGVTSIGILAFYNCSKLTSVTIPDSVTSLGTSALSGCSGLTSLTISDGMTSIGASTFSGCSGLTDVTIPDSVTDIGASAFSGCSGLTNVTIPDSVMNIGSAAFSGCSSLTNMVLPFVGGRRGNSGSSEAVFGYIFGTSSYTGSTGIYQYYSTFYIPTSLRSVTVTDETVLGYGAFYNCSGLTNVTIPDGVTSIGQSAFYGCGGLMSLTIPDSVTSIGELAFYNCNDELFDTTTIPGLKLVGGWVVGITDSLSGVLCLTGIHGIGPSAFSGCSELTGVIIPDGVTSIGQSAFSGCSGLTSLTIPDGVTSIGMSAFSGCSGLTDVTIPNSVTSIGQSAFSGCSGLTSLTISDGVTSIGASAFSGCSGLTGVTIPNSVTNIGSAAFSGCRSLTNMVLPFVGGRRGNSGASEAVFGYIFGTSSYTGSTRIWQCYSSSSSSYFYVPALLKSVTVTDETVFGYGAFYGCSGLTSVTIPDSVTSIGELAFYNCNDELFDTTTIPGLKLVGGWVVGITDSLSGALDLTGIRGICSVAFSDCSGLTSVTIPNSVTAIGAFAFSGCSGLTDVTIPDSVTDIGSSAFSGCSGLTDVTIPNTVTNIGPSAFSGCSSLTNMVLPFVGGRRGNSGSSDAVFGYIFGTSSYAGSTGIYQYYSTFYIPTSLRSVTVTDETVLGYGAFYNCSGLSDVTISACVTNIGEQAFYNCSGLVRLAIPDGVTSIGASAFSGCSGLTDVMIPNSVTSIGQSAFSGCSGLTSLTISDGMTSIGASTFSGCSGLTDVTIPNSVTSIGQSAFSGCSGLTSLTISDGVTSIGASAFSGCSGLTDVTIPNTVTNIGQSAFSGCSSLTNMVLPFVGRRRGNSGSSEAVFGYIFGTSTYAGSTGFYQYYSSGSSSYFYVPALLKSVTVTDETVLGYGAFYNCSGLSDVTISACVTSIAAQAFCNCSGLVSQTIPDGVTSIGTSAFSGCSGLTDVTIPNSVTSIEQSAFSGCSGLKDMTIPDSVTDIGASAFSGCSGLSDMTVPDSVANIGLGAFSGCSSLTNMVLPFVGARRGNSGSSDAVFGYIFGTSSYAGSAEIRQYYSSGSSSCFFIPTSLKSVTITDETVLGYGAFYNCSGLTDVAIPDSVTSIGASAFSGCSGLTSIVLPFVGARRGNSGSSDAVFGYIFGTSWYAGCTEIYQYYSTFYIPTSLRSVTVTDETVLGYGAFYNCSVLTNLTISDSVTSIEDKAFYGCNDAFFDTTTIPGLKLVGGWVVGITDSLSGALDLTGIQGICSSAFSDCSGLTSVTIPDSVTSIGQFAFSGCSGLTSVTISDSVTNIGQSAFSGCSSLTNMVLPFVGARRGNSGSSEAVFGYIFGTSSYTGSTGINQYYSTFYIPTSLRSVTVTDEPMLGYGAFYGCSGLSDVTMPDNVTNISERAFYNCSGLVSIMIPDSVTSIGPFAFSGCNGLTSVHISNLEAWYGISFGSSSANPLYCAHNLYLNDALVTNLTIPFGMTNIGEYAFYGCSGLTDVTIPDSVTKIGSSAFSGCSGLTSVTIPDSVTDIGASAFSGCSGLTSVTIPDSVTSIASFAFSGCSGLTSVTIPDSVTDIGASAFSGCSGLTSVTMPWGLLDLDNKNVWYDSLTVNGWSISENADGTIEYRSAHISHSGSTSMSMTITGPCELLFDWMVSSEGGYDYLRWRLDGVEQNRISGTGGGWQNVTYSVPVGSHTVTWTYSKDGSANSGEDCGWVRIRRSLGTITMSALFPNAYGNIQTVTLTGSPAVIPARAFAGCVALEAIDVPASVTNIGQFAFLDCSGLTDVTIPDSVTGIGAFAFSGCSGLTDVTIPNSVTSIEQSAFSGCSGLTSLTIPDSVTGIGASAFSGCSGLTDVTIPNSVTSIGQSAFSGCSGLTDVTIPNTVTNIGQSAFSGCNSLTNMVLPFVGGRRGNSGSSEAVFGYIFGTSTYAGSTGIDQYYSSGSSSYFYVPALLKSVTVTDETVLGYGAFYNCSGLTDVTIPDSVTSIGDYAFYNCSGLTDVTIPDSVTSIGSRAFSNCGRLTGVSIPNSVTNIGEAAFSGCDGLASVVISPGKALMVGSDAFGGCSRLGAVLTLDLAAWCEIEFANLAANPLTFAHCLYTLDGLERNPVLPESILDIPDCVEKIGRCVFSGCSGLTAVTIPGSVTNIGEYAFKGCSGLTAVTIPNGVTEIASFAFSGCSGLTSVTIPNSVTNIGVSAFSGCSGLTSLTIPDDVTDIGTSAFSGCSGLTSLTIPDSVTDIGTSAFSGCSGLTSVTIPNSVTNIGAAAFSGCSGLTSVYISDLAVWCAISFGDAFANPLYYAHNLYLNGVLVKNLTIPDSVTSIGAYVFYNCSGLTSVTIPNSVTSLGAAAFSGCSGLTSVKIPDSVTSIASSAFSGCSGLMIVKIPDSVTSIASSAFSGCSGLTSVKIPDSVTSIGASAFAGWSRLASVTIPNSVIDIGASAFAGCSGLTSVTIPNSVTNIGASAFAGCSGLASVIIPNSVMNIGASAFSGCGGLTSVMLPFVGGRRGNSGSSDAVFGYIFGTSSYAGSTEIRLYHSNGSSSFYIPTSLRSVTITDETVLGSGAFYNCSGLTSVTIPNCVTNIGASAFAGCSGLASIMIPDGVASLGGAAFSGCSGLTTVTVPNSVTSIEASAFSGCSGLTSLVLPFVGARRGNSGSSDAVFGYIFGTSSYTGSSGVYDYYYSNYDYRRYFYVPTSLKSVTITGETMIGDRAFSGYSGLVDVTILSDVMSIGSYAFSDCHGLTHVIIPDSVTSIGVSAFSGCGGLGCVVIPANVTSIGANAFASCPSLESVYMLGLEPPANYGNIYAGTPADLTTYVPLGAMGWFFSGYFLLPDAWPIGYGDDARAIAYGSPCLAEIVLDANGGEVLGRRQSVMRLVGYDLGALPYAMREGYVFDGWWTEASGGTQLALTMRVEAGMTCYAHWRARTYVVTFDAQGGSAPIAPKIVTYAATYGELPAPSRMGYTFDGWYTASSSGMQVTADTRVLIPADQTLYARWAPKTYELGYDNLFLFEKWANSSSGTSLNGLLTVDIASGVATLTNGNENREAYTLFAMGGDVSGFYKIPVADDAEHTMRLTLDGTMRGTVEVFLSFFDGASNFLSFVRWVFDSTGEKTFNFRTPAGALHALVRFDVNNPGDSISFSKIKICRTEPYANVALPDARKSYAYSDDAYGVLSEPTRPGYTFAGWYTGENGTGTRIMEDTTTVPYSQTVYSHWTTNETRDVTVDMGNGKSVMVPEAWLAEHSALVEAAGGDAVAALSSTAANGRMSVADCYVVGLDPEVETNDFRITSFPMKADGTPDLENIVFEPPHEQWNVLEARPVLKGAVNLSDTDWLPVTEENKAQFRFFRVEVELP